jgi:hypothetical protein
MCIIRIMILCRTVKIGGAAMRQLLIACAALLVVGGLTIGCQASQPSPTVKSLVVAGSAPTVGGAKQFTVTANFTDGTSRDVTNDNPGTTGPFWLSSNATAATVSSTGVVTGVAPGAATIYARYHNFTGNVTIQIN